MGIISVLSKQIANLIAAGEVVERPVSVIKELVENSIDAGADEIVIEIANGGTTHMRVTDNGCGMSKDDATVAFSRHATSKIKTSQDLSQIKTMGFRGEALAAIASVANVQMITRQKTSDSATIVEINAGEIINTDDIGAPVGTTMIVDNLFYNTPARMKFLKKDNTEAAVISSLVEKLAVANGKIAFKYIKDGRVVLQTDGEGMQSAVSAVFGSAIFAKMLKVDYELDGVKVSGFVGKPEISRPNRNMQLFSINSRTIRSRVFQFALEEALKNEIMTGKYPCCAINVDVDFSTVDVNVHPSKQEVKFANEKKLYDAVYFAVKNAFFADKSRPEFETKTTKNYNKMDVTPMPKQETFTSMSVEQYKKEVDVSAWSYPKATPVNKAENVASPTVSEVQLNTLVQRALEQKNKLIQQTKQAQQPKPQQEKTPEISDFRFVGELFKTYIVVEVENEVLLIDKHAARERILYEKIKASQKGASSQKLIAPVVLYLTGEETDAILQNIDFFKNIGFELEDFGDGSIMLRGVPSDIQIDDAQLLVTQCATKLIEGKKDAKPDIYDELMHSMACKAAMKGGQYNAEIDLINLAKQIIGLPDIKHCPHGRPVALTLTKSYIESQFKR